MKRLFLIVRATDDGSEASRVEVSAPTQRKVEKIISGLLRNMDTDRYYVDDSAFDHITD